jgi:hypothetical protein
MEIDPSMHLVNARDRMLEIPAVLLLQEQQHSPVLGVTSPPLHAGFSYDLACRHRDMSNGSPMAKRPHDLKDWVPRDTDSSTLHSGAGTGE